MRQHTQEPTLSDSIDEFFEPGPGDSLEKDFEPVKQSLASRERLADLRRKAEDRIEEKRLKDELGYYDLDH